MTRILVRTILLLALTTAGLSSAVRQPIAGVSTGMQEANQGRPVENVSVINETWLREGGLLSADLTVANVNLFPVIHVIVACEFVKQGTPIGSRASLVPLVLSPGISRVGGIEFVMSERDTEGGRCRILSAQRMWSEPLPHDGE